MASLPISHLPRSSPVWAPGALPLLSEPTDFSGCKRQPGEALPRAWNALLSSCLLLQDAAMRLPLLRLSMKPRFGDSAPFPSSADPWGSPARTRTLCTSSILETPHFLKPGDYGILDLWDQRWVFQTISSMEAETRSLLFTAPLVHGGI